MHRIRPFWRILRLGVHIISGVLIAATVAILLYLGIKPRRLAVMVQWWERLACRILHLKVRRIGEPAATTALVIANHVSWLDIPVLGGLMPVSFLSKAEVRDLPLIGWMAKAAGTLFIERGNHQSASISKAIHGHIDLGRNVLIFPEGTTSDGRDVRRFHPRLFAAAQNSGALIQPVSIRYLAAEGRESVAPFIGDETLPAHLLRILKEPEIQVEVCFARPIQSGDADRKTLAATTRQAIRDCLGIVDK